MTAPVSRAGDEVEALCEAMHDAYEQAAIGAGWETQERSRKPWADVPEANKETMRAVVRTVVLPRVQAARAEERAKWDEWVWEACIALRAATTIGQRSCRDGDHLNYGNHDRLLARAAALRTPDAAPETTQGEGHA